MGVDAERVRLTEWLGTDKQFRIPIYQRSYGWKMRDIERLFKDIIRAGSPTAENRHFIGAITIKMLDRSHLDDVTPFAVIDGQQRMTSILLLLRALQDADGKKTLKIE